MEVTLNKMKGQKMSIKTLSTKDLREIELREYNTLKTLNEILHEKEEENDDEGVEVMTKLVEYQRGKWGIISDLLEKLEDENE